MKTTTTSDQCIGEQALFLSFFFFCLLKEADQIPAASPRTGC